MSTMLILNNTLGRLIRFVTIYVESFLQYIIIDLEASDEKTDLDKKNFGFRVSGWLMDLT